MEVIVVGHISQVQVFQGGQEVHQVSAGNLEGADQVSLLWCNRTERRRDKRPFIKKKVTKPS